MSSRVLHTLEFRALMGDDQWWKLVLFGPTLTALGRRLEQIAEERGAIRGVQVISVVPHGSQFVTLIYCLRKDMITLKMIEEVMDLANPTDAAESVIIATDDHFKSTPKNVEVVRALVMLAGNDKADLVIGWKDVQ